MEIYPYILMAWEPASAAEDDLDHNIVSELVEGSELAEALILLQEKKRQGHVFIKGAA